MSLSNLSEKQTQEFPGKRDQMGGECCEKDPNCKKNFLEITNILDQMIKFTSISLIGPFLQHSPQIIKKIFFFEVMNNLDQMIKFNIYFTYERSAR